MAVHEWSFGPLYLAKVKTTPARVPTHSVGVTQMHPPWRVGRAAIFPIWSHTGAVVGWWKKTIDEGLEEDFSDEQWISPRRAAVGTEEIRKWEIDEEEQEAAIS